jgi:hypothetical protein
VVAGLTNLNLGGNLRRTDNDIPGIGRCAYSDYDWPSLRQALQQYGLFGRRYGKQTTSPDCPK